MTQDEIIEMAREAGFVEYELDDGTTTAFDKRYEAFAKLVAAKAFQNGYEKGVAGFNEAVSLEREACAKVCEHQPHWVACAAAIRARGEQA